MLAWRSHMSERCLRAWHSEARGCSQDLIVKRAMAQQQAVVAGAVKCVSGARSRLLLRRCLQALALVIQAEALAARQTVLEEEASVRNTKVTTWDRHLHGVLSSMLSREVRDVLRLAWLFWRGFAAASGLWQKALEAEKIRSADLAAMLPLSAFPSHILHRHCGGGYPCTPPLQPWHLIVPLLRGCRPQQGCRCGYASTSSGALFS